MALRCACPIDHPLVCDPGGDDAIASLVACYFPNIFKKKINTAPTGPVIHMRNPLYNRATMGVFIAGTLHCMPGAIAQANSSDKTKPSAHAIAGAIIIMKMIFTAMLSRGFFTVRMSSFLKVMDAMQDRRRTSRQMLRDRIPGAPLRSG
ncbi:hypothetical protein [Massilia sp. CF038]|uniref:hypothetical protein n=1 Tax=Massilia sp. CF038 TaxID=1881045 RepID=UPI001160E9EC|nr:hypothetical protein [Massilia sp. CF038]